MSFDFKFDRLFVLPETLPVLVLPGAQPSPIAAEPTHHCAIGETVYCCHLLAVLKNILYDIEVATTDLGIFLP